MNRVDNIIQMKYNKEKIGVDMQTRKQTSIKVNPFTDGNGRTSRLVMNLILLQHGFPIANISSQNNLSLHSHPNT